MNRLTAPALRGLRAQYEPFAHALSEHFMVALPPWLPEPERPDNWEATGWREQDVETVSESFQEISNSDQR
jgi:hypothetical protein